MNIYLNSTYDDRGFIILKIHMEHPQKLITWKHLEALKPSIKQL
jgi:hypothetical protein